MVLGLPETRGSRNVPAVPGDIIKAREIFNADALLVLARRPLGFPKESRFCSRGVMFEVERRVRTTGDGDCDVALECSFLDGLVHFGVPRLSCTGISARALLPLLSAVCLFRDGVVEGGSEWGSSGRCPGGSRWDEWWGAFGKQGQRCWRELGCRRWYGRI